MSKLTQEMADELAKLVPTIVAELEATKAKAAAEAARSAAEAAEKKVAEVKAAAEKLVTERRAFSEAEGAVLAATRINDRAKLALEVAKAKDLLQELERERVAAAALPQRKYALQTLIDPLETLVAKYSKP